MSNNSKRPDTSRSDDHRAMSLESLPEGILCEIMQKLELDSLCSASCLSSTLRSAASHSLSILPSLDLSAFSPDAQTLGHILHRLTGLKSATIDCLRLDDYSVFNVFGPCIHDLKLLKCSSLSYHVIRAIGQSCSNLRILLLELAGQELSETFKKNLVEMLKELTHLESLSLKTRETEAKVYDLQSIILFLPKTLKSLKLQPVDEQSAIQFIHGMADDRTIPATSPRFSYLSNALTPRYRLQYLSLVLDVISDELIVTIVNSLPLLVELDLEDKPFMEPSLPHDLTNNGLQSLGLCQHLVTLSIVRTRSRLNHPVFFRRVNDLGMFLLSESCTGLQSVCLGGFTTVTDAGFSSILRSCHNLRKFEIRNASQLSDLAFHDLMEHAPSLVELRLLSCNLITSEAMQELSSSRAIEVLDLCGCKSIANPCLSYISGLASLKTLNLAGADVTDSGLALIGKGKSPIEQLCLRGCKRVSERGIALLLNDSIISKTLSSLDLGYMPGISDAAILTIATAALSITELCIRYCFFVTDASLKALASERRSDDGNGTVIQRIDLFHCLKLSDEVGQYFLKPCFPGLKWLGVGRTRLACKKEKFDAIFTERPWLTVCYDGCEVGCHDGWQFHRLDGT